jgi:Uma2 family endonuclease
MVSQTQTSVEKKPVRKKPLLPYKLVDRLKLPALVRVPGTFEDWLELSLECEYKVEYINGDVISIFETDRKNKKRIMGQASFTHEELVMNIGFALNLLFKGKLDFHIVGSNMPTFLSKDTSYVNPDVILVKGEQRTEPYKFKRKSQVCLMNPYIVVEVLSQSTRDFDLVEKFNQYKKSETIQQIIFVEQYWSQVMTYIRQSDNIWTYIEMTDISTAIPVETGSLLLSDIYQRITF